jgi:hypothetical protein
VRIFKPADLNRRNRQRRFFFRVKLAAVSRKSRPVFQNPRCPGARVFVIRPFFRKRKRKGFLPVELVRRNRADVFRAR